MTSCPSPARMFAPGGRGRGLSCLPPCPQCQQHASHRERGVSKYMFNDRWGDDAGWRSRCFRLQPFASCFGVILISHSETRGGGGTAPQRHHPAWAPTARRSQCVIGPCSHTACVAIFIDVVFRSCSLDTGDGSVTSGHPPDGGWPRQVRWGGRHGRLGSEGSCAH